MKGKGAFVIRLFGKDSKAAILVSGNDKGILRTASALAKDIRKLPAVL